MHYVYMPWGGKTALSHNICDNKSLNIVYVVSSPVWSVIPDLHEGLRGRLKHRGLQFGHAPA